jgi:hypothetical protein
VSAVDLVALGALHTPEELHAWARWDCMKPEKFAREVASAIVDNYHWEHGWCPWPAWKVAEALLDRMRAIPTPVVCGPSVGHCGCGATYVGKAPDGCFFCGKEVGK